MGSRVTDYPYSSFARDTRAQRDSLDRALVDLAALAAGFGARVPPNHGLTFREWIRTGVHRRSTRADLDQHLTTLFPPVVPRGRPLELRTIDAQSGGDWIVPVALCAALLDDPAASEAATAALEPVWEDPAGLYRRAASDALADRAIATAARTCVDAALEALVRGGEDEQITTAVARFVERYTARGRTPADELAETEIARRSGQAIPITGTES